MHHPNYYDFALYTNKALWSKWQNPWLISAAVHRERGQRFYICELCFCERTSSPVWTTCLLAWPSSTVRTRCAKFKLHTDSPRFFSTGAICTIIKVLLSPPTQNKTVNYFSKGLKFSLIHVYLTSILNFSYPASPAVGRWVWSSYREHGSVYSAEHGLRPLNRTATCWCSGPPWVEFHLHQTYWLAQTLPSPLG